MHTVDAKMKFAITLTQAGRCGGNTNAHKTMRIFIKHNHPLVKAPPLISSSSAERDEDFEGAEPARSARVAPTACICVAEDMAIDTVAMHSAFKRHEDQAQPCVWEENMSGCSREAAANSGWYCGIHGVQNQPVNQVHTCLHERIQQVKSLAEGVVGRKSYARSRCIDVDPNQTSACVSSCNKPTQHHPGIEAG